MVSIEKYVIPLLLFLITAVGAAVKWFALSGRARRLAPQKRIRLIIVFTVGLTLLFNIVFYYSMKRELGSDSSLIFVPILIFTLSMVYAMAEVTFKVRREITGKTGDKHFVVRFASVMVIFASLTVASIAYVVFNL